MSVRRDRDPRTASSEGVRVTQRGRAVTIGETDPRTSEGQDVPVTPQTALSPHSSPALSLLLLSLPPPNYHMQPPPAGA